MAETDADPVRLNFGEREDGPHRSASSSAEMDGGSKEALGRQVLKQIQNADLSLPRAWKAFVPGGNVERDLAQAKEEFSKVKFTYQELSAKNDFIRNVVEGDAQEERDAQAAEERLAEGKVALKKTKERCKALRDEVEIQLAEACHKYELLQAETESFRAFVESGSYSDEGQVTARLAGLEAQIQQQQHVIRTQEEAIRDLSQQRQELSMAVRGLDTEVSEMSENAHPSAEDMQVVP
jgi:chromosome segregation ATPase